MPRLDESQTPEQMRAAAESVVRRLRARGHVAYFAGGCVRDAQMGRIPSDYDVATDALPDEVASVFSTTRYVGEAFGVVMVREKRVWIEVATFRIEWDYADGRHPGRVEFTDAENDARRRDFTINGLFYDPITDEVIDHVEGCADIEARVIRAIGDPVERFGEDYLRMLRAVRFAARLGFEMEPATQKAVRDLAPHLEKISRERIGMELRAMLTPETRGVAAEWVERLGLDAPVFHESPKQGAAMVRSVDSAEASLALVLAVWAVGRHVSLPSGASGEVAAGHIKKLKVLPLVRRWRAALALSNDERDALRDLLSGLAEVLRWDALAVAQRKRLMARSVWPDLVRLLGACVRCSRLDWADARIQVEMASLASEGVAPDPLITGDDLLIMGLSPGPAFRRILDAVYDAQLERRITSAEEAIELARSLF